MSAPASFRTCPECSSHVRVDDAACPFCATGEGERGTSLLGRLGLKLKYGVAVVGISTTAVACYGGPGLDPIDCDDPANAGYCNPDTSCEGDGCGDADTDVDADADAMDTAIGVCTSDTDCALGQVCDAGVCVEETVPPPVRPRVDRPCEADAECAGEGRCMAGRCEAACVVAPDCTRTEACVDAFCVPEPTGGGECADSRDCEGDAVCINAFCVPQCTAEDEATVCGEGEFCDQGLCRPDWRPQVECVQSVDCAAGLTCVDAQCRQGCWSDADCAAGLSCVDNFCASP